MNAPTATRRARLALLLLLDLALLAALAAAVWFDNAANRGITYNPNPEHTFAAGPTLGVNLYNIQYEPDPEAVQRSFALAAELGARYARMQVPWEDIEIHARGDFTDRRNESTVGVLDAWAKYDAIVREANAADVQLIMRVDRPPAWARQQFIASPFFQAGLAQDGNSTGPPDDFADYGRFVAALVERYDGDGNADAPGSPIVRHFQIWNEPNLKNEWNWQTPQPEDFTELLRVGASAARAASPDVVILFPGLAPTDGLDPRAPMTELEYLDRVYKAGGAAYFDVMAAQAYGLGQPPDEHRYVFLRGRGNWNWSQPVDTRNDVSRVVLLREVMERNGDAATPVWVTEFGWNSAPDSIPPERRLTWGEPVSEEIKGEYLVGQIERARAEWPWMSVMNVWMLRYGGYAEPDPADPTPYFALVTRDWQPLPAYRRLQEFVAAPALAGPGVYSWDHPAVEPIDGGWRVRFLGTSMTMVGASESGIETTIDGQPAILGRAPVGGILSLRTPDLPFGEHLLEVRGQLNPQRLIVSRERPLPWLYDNGPLAIVLALALAGAATTAELFRAADDLRRLWRERAGPRARAALALGLMALTLLVFYRASPQLPLTLAGLAAFAGLALWRPDLALLFVPLSVPLYFMPKGIFDTRFGLREDGLFLPLHELVLLIALAATAARWLFGRLMRGDWRLAIGGRWRDLARDLAPVALFGLAGLWGAAIAGERGPALRELRWLVIEPLIFYGLLRFWASHGPEGRPAAAYRLVPAAFLLGGALVGLVGLLQFAGLNLVPLIGSKVGFSDDSLLVEGVRRVNSVYGHPNNLGLYMGRIWPLAAALALWAWRSSAPRWRAGLYALAALLALGGLAVSFSRGAYLGALVAAAALAASLLPRRAWASRRVILPLAGLATLGLVAVIAVVALDIERFNPFGASSGIRLKTWASALAMLRDHPLGVGLDQFGQFYPQYIDPSLADTNEINTAHPHNLLLDIALRLGPLGLVAFAWLVARLLRQLWPDPQSPRYLAAGLLAATCAALAHGLVDSFYFWPDLAFAFWMFVALAQAPPDDTPEPRPGRTAML